MGSNMGEPKYKTMEFGVSLAYTWIKPILGY